DLFAQEGPIDNGSCYSNSLQDSLFFAVAYKQKTERVRNETVPHLKETAREIVQKCGKVCV
ncbi:hypothetical protein AAUPMB_03388, partial [Pasteurella multocida subsp. multocida str. Anand1_buffalo]